MAEESPPLYEKVLYQNDLKHYQLRLVLNEFRDKQYLHLRKYFLSFEDDYVPTREGASMEASICNIYALLDGLLELVSSAEGIEGIEQHFKEKIDGIRSRSED